MKKLSTIVFLTLYIGSLGLTSVYAADTTGDKTIVGQKITTLQATDSGLPGGVTEQKGSVGTILSKVFDATGQIGNVYLKAIGTITSGYVPRWNGTSLINGQIRDDGTNVGIGASAITGIKLGVSGIIRSTTDMQANRYCDTAGGNCFTPTQVDLNGADIGGSGTPNYIPKFVGTGTTLANSSIQDNGSIITIPIPTTFSQTLNAQTGYTIGGKNLVSNNGVQITANYPDNTRYGYFEVRNNSNQRGAYFGFGNGGNTVDLTLDNASNLSISGGNTLIGGATTLSSVNNTSTTPDILFNQAGLIASEASTYINIDSTNTSTSGVFKVGKDSGTATATEIFSVNEAGNGNFLGTVTAATPTAATHLTTKAYVDAAVIGGGDNLGNHIGTQDLVFNNYGFGQVGLYSSTRYQNVFSMGTAYTPADDGTGLGNMYGIAWTHSNVAGESKPGLGHQALFVQAGTTRTAIGNGIWTAYDITANRLLDQNNTAYYVDPASTSNINALTTVGNVGIGTTTPIDKLEVSGNMTINAGGNYSELRLGSSTYDKIISDNTAAKSYGGGYWFRVNNATTGYIDALMIAETGNIGIGTVSPSQKLDVNGNINSSGDVIAGGEVVAGRQGVKGNYNSTQVQGIWSMGTQYDVDMTGNNFGTQWGMVYAHTNAGTAAYGGKLPIAGQGHQILFTSAGTTEAMISLSNGNAQFNQVKATCIGNCF